MQAVLPKDKVSFIPKGQDAQTFTPGDFILVNDHSFFSSLIAFGQNLRFPKSRFNQWTHVALIATPEGELIEADGKKVSIVKLSKYTNSDYFLVNILATIEDRHEAVSFAHACLNESYGWTTILSVAFSLLTGLHFSFGFDGQEICSGLVARALERTSAIFPRDPSHLTPSEIARYYLEENVQILQKGV